MAPCVSGSPDSFPSQANDAEGVAERRSRSDQASRIPNIHLSGEKPYKCHHCDYAAIQKGDLECHMWTHTGEKPYKCQNCDYTASKKYHLELHMATHTGEKPYKCSQCEYTTNQSHLKSHVRTHTGEKPYKCTRFFRISDFSKIFDFTCFYNCFL